MPLTLSPSAITRHTRRVPGAESATSRTHREGVVAVTLNAGAESAADAEQLRRRVSAVLLRLGYETVARGRGELLVLLPEPIAEGEVVPARVVEQEAPLQGEFRETEHGLRYLTVDEVAAERAVEPDTTSGPLAHEHEEWQLDESAQSGRYCRACGATVPTHYTREQVEARFREVDEFVLTLGPDDTAYDPETGDTLLGGVTIRYARGSFPGSYYVASILDEDPHVDDEPRSQAAPLEWSEVAEVQA